MAENQDVAQALIKKIPTAAVTSVVALLAVGYFLTSTNLNAPLIKMLEATTVASNEQTDSVKRLSVDIRDLAKVVRDGNTRVDALNDKLDKSTVIFDRRITMLEDIVIHKQRDNIK